MEITPLLFSTCSYRRVDLGFVKEVSTQVTIDYSREPEIGESHLAVAPYVQQMTDIYYSCNVYISRPFSIKNHTYSLKSMLSVETSLIIVINCYN